MVPLVQHPNLHTSAAAQHPGGPAMCVMPGVQDRHACRGRSQYWPVSSWLRSVGGSGPPSAAKNSSSELVSCTFQKVMWVLLAWKEDTKCCCSCRAPSACAKACSVCVEAELRS